MLAAFVVEACHQIQIFMAVDLSNSVEAPKSRFIAHDQIPSIVRNWLILGLVMIFFQVVIGGVTRLTGSGLSITKWEIITGTFPPTSAAKWEKEFDAYKATPQYQKINEGMSMSEFKFIYFWEYFHRLWARLMGLVFVIPFCLFWRRRAFSRQLFRQLIAVFLLAAFVASFGWIMVASGLDDRPWVNAYKLTMHLSLAFICYAYLWWTTLGVIFPKKQVFHNLMLKKLGIAFLVLLSLQIALGGTVSGMKAALSFPTWPDMNGDFVPAIIFDSSEWTVDNFVNYDRSGFIHALIQTLHRMVAYLLTVIGLWFFFKARKSVSDPIFRLGLTLWITMLVIQVGLGIITVINSRGTIPVDWGVFHQAGALLLLTATLFLCFRMRKTA